MENTLIATGDNINGQNVVIVEPADNHLPVDPEAFKATERIYPPKVHDIMSEKESLHILKGLASDHSELLLEMGQRLQSLEAVIANQSQLILLLTERIETSEATTSALAMLLAESNNTILKRFNLNRDLHQMD